MAALDPSDYRELPWGEAEKRVTAISAHLKRLRSRPASDSGWWLNGEIAKLAAEEQFHLDCLAK